MELEEKIYVTKGGEAIYRRPETVTRGETAMKNIAKLVSSKTTQANREEKTKQEDDQKEEGHITEAAMTYRNLRRKQKTKRTSRQKSKQELGGSTVVRTKAGQNIIMNPDSRDI